MPVLLLIVFVDMVGFGLLLPLLPFYVQRVGEDPQVITAVLGLYSLGQFIAAPIWGRISDRFGRKPVLVLTSFGYALSFLLLAYADSLWLLIASRLFGGLMAGNLSAAQAYVSDITTPENRAKGMGLIGAAFGMGFVFGPAIGGILSGGDPATADYVRPALAAAALTAVAAFGAVFFLKESLTPENRAAHPDSRRYFQFGVFSGRAALAMLVAGGFLVIAGWAQFETVFSLWANAVLHYGPRQVGFVMTFMGVLSAVVQGGGVGALTPRLGEQRLVIIALLVLAAGYAALAVADSLATVLVAAGLLGLGSALFTPTVSSLVSQQARGHEQGAVLGVYQSATALSRFAGPAVSGSIYAAGGPSAPFIAAAVLILPAGALFLAAGRARRASL